MAGQVESRMLTGRSQFFDLGQQLGLHLTYIHTFFFGFRRRGDAGQVVVCLDVRADFAQGQEAVTGLKDVVGLCGGRDYDFHGADSSADREQVWRVKEIRPMPTLPLVSIFQYGGCRDV